MFKGKINQKKQAMKTITLIFSLMIITGLWTESKAQDDCSVMYFSKTISGNFEEVTREVIAEFKSAGFGVITEINMDQVLQDKLEGVSMNPYKILGVCNPGYAYEAIRVNPNAGVLLPCKVIIKQLEEDKIEVVALNPVMVMKMFDNKELDTLAKEVAQKMRSAIEGI